MQLKECTVMYNAKQNLPFKETLHCPFLLSQQLEKKHSKQRISQTDPVINTYLERKSCFAEKSGKLLSTRS